MCHLECFSSSHLLPLWTATEHSMVLNSSCRSFRKSNSYQTNTYHANIITLRYSPSTTLPLTNCCHQNQGHMLLSLWLCCSWVEVLKGIRTFGYEHGITNTKILRLAGLPSIILCSFFIIILTIIVMNKTLHVLNWTKLNLFIRAYFLCQKSLLLWSNFQYENYIHKRWFIIFSTFFKLIT